MVIIHHSGTVDLTLQQKWGYGPQHEQEHAETRSQQYGANLVAIGMSTQTHAGEKKAPEPR